MKKFLGFVKKEFFHIFRDYRTLIVLFGMPVAQIMIFGFAITTEIKDANIAFLDLSKDNVTKEISDKIISSGYFKLFDNLNSYKQIEDEFKKGEVREVIVFEDNFGEKLNKEGRASVQLIADASDPNLANMLIGYTSAIIAGYNSGMKSSFGLNNGITTEVKMIFNPEMKSVYMFVPGLMAVILLLVSALMTSISITREKELGTMEVLLASPLKPVQIIIGKVIPYVVIAFANAAIIIILAKYVFEMPLKGNLIMLILESILYVITALSLGILISTVSSNQQVAMLASLAALLLPTILLSGFIYPVENMHWILQWLSYIIPAKYFIIILKAIMIKGNDFSYYWKETLILSGMTVFFILLSAKKFKIRLE
ncbi:MAG: ABC transporter permease [Ignavibacteria bacterium]|nr:ABC transporter permease [Ignavibacteria bacterium]